MEPGGELWTAEEVAWARECFRSGDGVGEIAEAADRCFLDVALKLGVYGFVEKERRWAPSFKPGGSTGSRWVGGLLKEVAVYRCVRGEEPSSLTALAQVNRTSMFKVLQGLVRRRHRLPAEAQFREAA